MNIYPSLSTLSNSDDNSPSNSTENMSVSLEIAEKLLIKFDGSKNKLYEFIDNCEKAISLVKPEFKNVLLSIIETKLTDKARAITRNRKFDEWNDLKSFLLDAYSEKRTEGQWQLELHSLRQIQGETVISFANKVENCYIKLINALDSDLSIDAKEACTKLIKNQSLNVFIRGLNKDLSLMVKSRNPDSLEKAISLALAEEQELISLQEMFKVNCNICKKSNHSTSNCRYKNQPERNIRYFQNKNPNQNPQNYDRNKQPHHFQSQQIFCRYCKKPGHLINECRKRQYNNNKKSQTTNTNFVNNTNSNSLNSQQPRQETVNSRGIHSVQAEFQQ